MSVIFSLFLKLLTIRPGTKIESSNVDNQKYEIKHYVLTKYKTILTIC